MVIKPTEKFSRTTNWNHVKLQNCMCFFFLGLEFGNRDSWTKFRYPFSIAILRNYNGCTGYTHLVHVGYIAEARVVARPPSGIPET